MTDEDLLYTLQECVLDKRTAEMKVKRENLFQKLVPGFPEQKISKSYLWLLQIFNMFNIDVWIKSISILLRPLLGLSFYHFPSFLILSGTHACANTHTHTSIA